MKVIVLFRPNSEHSGVVEDFTRDFERFKSRKLELISLDTIEGDDLARLYDITSYPAFLVISEGGSLQRMWQGMPLPMIDELAYYTADQETHVFNNSITHRLKVLQPLAA